MILILGNDTSTLWYNNNEVNIMPSGIYKRDSVEKRFFDKVDRGADCDCWEFTGGISSDGRGVFWLDGKSFGAHRMAWKLAYGDIPNGMLICHHCDNGKCCNPNHLFLGTYLDNMQDMKSKGRQVHLYGDNDPKSKLKSEEVLEIVRLYKTGKFSQSYLGKMFCVSRSAILNILKGRTWRETTKIDVPLNLFSHGRRPQFGLRNV